MDKKFDSKNHTVLGYWPKANYACLMLNQARDFPFVAAYGYDPETKEWSQGHYFATATEAWNTADPHILARLSEPVTVRDILEDIHDADYEHMEDFQDVNQLVEDYADDCHRYILPYRDYFVESDAIREWLGDHREEAI